MADSVPCGEPWRGFATDDGTTTPCRRPLGHPGSHGPAREGEDHNCCPCVERLRAQNKASSDEWTKRTADMQSDLYGLRSLMAEAGEAHRKGHIGISQYGQAALAAALKVADEAEGRAEAMEAQMLRERRHRIAAERDRDRLREQFMKATNRASNPPPSAPC